MPNPILLDITRLYSRRGLDFDTGIDRVLRAYFSEAGQQDNSVFLIRRGRFYFCVDYSDARRLIEPLPRKTDIVTLLRAAKSISRDIVELPTGTRFFHIGHSHHGAKFWQSLAAQNVYITIFVHDVIPLEYPQYMRAGSADSFARQFSLWQKYASRFLTNSNSSRDAILRHLHQVVEVRVQPLAAPTAQQCETSGDPKQFLMLGTIEPRKNHLTILRAWERLAAQLGDECPILHIVGKRGWNNDEVFSWLDTNPLIGNKVIEHGALDDQQLARLFCEAQTHIIASHVEGYGLPAIEAALAGRMLMLSDIEVFRELFEAHDNYFTKPNDIQAWVDAVTQSKQNKPKLIDGRYYPDWRSYFSAHPIESDNI